MKHLLLPLCTIVVAFTTIGGLYTNNQLEALIDGLVFQAKLNIEYPTRNTSPWVLELGDVISRNGDAIVRTDWVSSEVNSGRFEAWKTQVIANPSLGTTAIATLGPNLVRQINSRLSYEAASSDFQFDERIFWNRQKGHVSRYKSLVQNVLTLEDSDLNYFMSTNTSKASSFEFNQFLESRGLVSSSLEGPSVQYWRYPGDLIQLVKRTAEKRDDMSYRRGFEVALSYIEAVEAILPA